LEDRCKERVEAGLSGDERTAVLRGGMGRPRTRRIEASGCAVQSAERIVALALRKAASDRAGTDRLVWNRFVEWWCLPAPEREDERAGPDFGGEPGADAGFFAFELACLMNEIGQRKASAGGDCGTGTP
jgi:hypothetical protein